MAFQRCPLSRPAPASPGARTDVGKTEVPAHKVEGGQYPHQPPRMDNDTNQSAPVRSHDEVSAGNSHAHRHAAAEGAPIGDPPAINFEANNPVGINGAGQGCSGDSPAACAEPSGASGGG